MTTAILSVLVFILLQGCAVCDDLYPISVLRGLGFIEDHVEGSSDVNNTIEARTLAKPYVPADASVKWIQQHIVQKYKFVKDSVKTEWKGQPTFANQLGQQEFTQAAQKVENFFKKYNDWGTTKKTFSCIDLLYITAARYLLVTQILYEESSKKLVPCSTLQNKKVKIPGKGVCYPTPYGSATCTSDYDVGLVGKDSGTLTKRFNARFHKMFGKPSELVFDTNIYAFTLEYSMPFHFVGLPDQFGDGVAKKEKTVNFRMQELASAYYKVYKYNGIFFTKLVAEAKKAMDLKKAGQSKKKLEEWLKTFSALDGQVPLRLPEFKSVLELRQDHNKKYDTIVQEMSKQGGFKVDLLGNLAMALIYAAEAYHTRGAIRHVVGGSQIKVISIVTSKLSQLSDLDLWVSMIENWGESNKEYNHNKNDPMETCFLKMSKYMWRTFNAMRLLRDRIPASLNKGTLIHFGDQYKDPEFAMKMWLDYKKQGKTVIPKYKKNVKAFLTQFGCNAAVFGRPISPDCLSKMNDKVNEYNVKLAAMVKDKSS